LAKQMENLVHRFSAPQSLEPENESKDEGWMINNQNHGEETYNNRENINYLCFMRRRALYTE
jgi:hypothetical protein